MNYYYPYNRIFICQALQGKKNIFYGTDVYMPHTSESSGSAYVRNHFGISNQSTGNPTRTITNADSFLATL